jgi:hypothetical protein
MDVVGYLGIDFGTTNSYFCSCDRYLTVTTIKFDQSLAGGTLPTAVLWPKEGAEPNGATRFGNYAIAAWGQMSADERKQCHFATQFKPDLAVSNAAREAAGRFLSAARRHLVETGKVRALGVEEGRPVVIGVPANWGEAQRQTVRAIAREAGYGEVTCAEEPVGALVFHLREGTVKPSDARKGTLVIDFGGGTLDVALLVRGRVVKSWGDSLLGGRLFDDIFFQWTLDENPGLLDRWQEDETLFYHQMHSCREMKERFSRAMAMREADGGLHNFSYLMQPGPGGLNIRGGAQQEFERRCREYRPSAQLRAMFEAFGLDYARLRADAPIDLFEWMRHGIAESPEGLVRASDVDLIIITGGSGNWPFFPNLVQAIFPAALMERSPDPEAAIASGLALLRPLQERYRHTTAVLKEEVEKKSDDLWIEVRDSLRSAADAIAEDITVELYDGKVVPLFQDFRRKGGKLTELRERVEREVRQFQPRVEPLVRERVTALQPLLERRIRENILGWFAEHQVGWEVREAPDTSLAPVRGFDMIPQRLADYLFLPDIAVFSLLSATVVGSLAGGAGIHFILAGPHGWLIGAVIGLLGAFGLGTILEGVPIPGYMTRTILWPSRLNHLLDKGRRDLRATLTDRISTEIANKKPAIRQHLREEMNGVIDALSFVDTLLSR